MADLTLTHLRVVVEVAARGSISAAASALGYEQSSISRQLQGAEVAVDAVLFERSAAGVRPTPAGDALVRHARLVLGEVDAANAELATLRGGLTGTLAIGAFPTAHAWIVPAAAALLGRRHPCIRVEPSEAASPALVRLVRSGLLHGALIAVGSGLPDYDLDGLAVATMPPGPGVGVVVARHHPLADRASLRLSDLSGRRWVVGVGARGEPQFGAWPAAADPDIAFEVQSWQARMGLVASDLAISVVPGIAAPVLPRGVVWIPVDDTAFDGRRLVVVMPARPQAGAQAFASSVAEVLRTRP